MDNLKKNVDIFINSIENNGDMIVIQNNLSVLIAQINIFYYKYNILNNKTCLNENQIKLDELDDISKKIRNIYPKFVELRKAHFKKIFIDKLQCDKNPNGLIDNITRSNKVQKMITDLTELLYIDSNSILEKNNYQMLQSKIKTSSIFIIIITVLIILAIIIFIGYKYYKVYKKTNSTGTSEAA